MAGFIFLGKRYIGRCTGASEANFGGLYIAPADCFIDLSGVLQIDTMCTTSDTSYGLGVNNTYGVSQGTLSNACSYFTRDNLATYFGCTTSMLGVRTLNKTTTVTDASGNEWRVATLEEMNLICQGKTDLMGTTTREGAYVNGTAMPSAVVSIRPNGSSIYPSSCMYQGRLLFPDGMTFTGASVSYSGSGGSSNMLTYDQLLAYVSQGAIFVRNAGGYYEEQSRYWNYQTGTDAYSGSYWLGFGTWYDVLDYGNGGAYPNWYDWSDGGLIPGQAYGDGANEPKPVAGSLRLIRGTINV